MFTEALRKFPMLTQLRHEDISSIILRQYYANKLRNHYTYYAEFTQIKYAEFTQNYAEFTHALRMHYA